MPNNASKTEIYENIVMIHPDGTPMCTMSRKRALWYVSRSLADWIDETSFKLKFEPKGWGNSGSDFYMQFMPNECVCCGADEKAGLNKHHVVPYVFRSRLPEEYKNSNHHDIVSICLECHEKYESFAMDLKKEIAAHYGFGFQKKMPIEEKENKRILAARNLLSKIQNNEIRDANGNVPKIPEEKINDLIETASQTLHELNASNYEPHWADKIIEKVLEEDSLFEFIKSWREHFIKIMEPKFLSPHWSVDHPIKKESVKSSKMGLNK